LKGDQGVSITLGSQKGANCMEGAHKVLKDRSIFTTIRYRAKYGIIMT